jgi:hypothetical protein
MILSGGGIIMSSKDIGLPNTIKYSIWETRTNEKQPATKEKSPESIERPILESRIEGNQE